MDEEVADSTVCLRCGMPLAYDRAMLAEAVRQRDGLCSFCVDPRARPLLPYREAAWALDLVLRSYRDGGRAARLLARLGRRLPLPLSAKALCELLHMVPQRRDSRRFDAIVLYSGGKDSSFMLLDLAKRGLKLCAWMLNQGYQSQVAIDNARRLCERLNVPLHIDKPEKKQMDPLFRIGMGIKPGGPPAAVKAAMTYGSACWPCFATIMARATRFAAENDVAFCFIGTQAGQNRLDVGTGLSIEGIIPRPEHLLEQFIGPIAGLAAAHAPDSASLLERFKVPETLLLPYYEFIKKPSPAEQIAELSRNGWKMPNNTGACSTNCMINELGRKVMRKRFGFDLYQIIEANERRLHGESTVAPSIAPLDGDAVERGAAILRLTPDERVAYGLE